MKVRLSRAFLSRIGSNRLVAKPSFNTRPACSYPELELT